MNSCFKAADVASVNFMGATHLRNISLIGSDKNNCLVFVELITTRFAGLNFKYEGINKYLQRIVYPEKTDFNA